MDRNATGDEHAIRNEVVAPALSLHSERSHQLGFFSGDIEKEIAVHAPVAIESNACNRTVHIQLGRDGLRLMQND
jgi:hypothetical protein